MSVQTRDSYQDFLEKTADKVREIKRNHELSEFDQAGLLFKLNLYRSVASIHFGDLSKSANYLVKAYQAHQDLMTIHSAHPEARFSLAFFNVLSQQIPEKFRGMVKYSESSFSSGYDSFKRLFRQYAGSGNLIEAESGLIWVLMLWELSDHPAALQSAWDYVNQYSDLNQLLITRYLGTMVGFKTGNSTLLEEIFAGLDPKALDRLPYFYYQRGKYRLLNLEPEGEGDMTVFLQTHGDANFSRPAMQKLAWYYDVKGERVRANAWYDRLLDQELDDTWADQQAIRETSEQRPYYPDLLRIRMLYDGTQYQKCLEEAQKLKESSAGKSEAYLAELIYRTGRAQLGLGEATEALESFKELLSQYAETESYLVPKSAILAAELCIDQGRTDEALYYLHLADEYNRYGYKSTFNRQIESLKRQLER